MQSMKGLMHPMDPTYLYSIMWKINENPEAHINSSA